MAQLPPKAERQRLTRTQFTNERTKRAQQNALLSYREMGHTEVFLYGDVEGIEDMAAVDPAVFTHLPLPDMEHAVEAELPLLPSLFKDAAQRAKGKMMMFINADMIMPRHGCVVCLVYSKPGEGESGLADAVTAGSP